MFTTHKDTHSAFLCSLSSSLKPAAISQGITITRPSLPTFAIKDVFHLPNGRAPLLGHPNLPNITTNAPSPVLRRLLDIANLVGITQTTEFCDGLDSTEWIHATCPMNPRGDGYQKPSGSSTGAAVAAAAYDWLDFTVGTDTGGSIRHPAGVQGVFGLRPTHNKVDMTGVVGTHEDLDTVGIFARDVSMFTRIGRFIMQAPENTEKQQTPLLHAQTSIEEKEGLVRDIDTQMMQALSQHAEAELVFPNPSQGCVLPGPLLWKSADSDDKFPWIPTPPDTPSPIMDSLDHSSELGMPPKSRRMKINLLYPIHGPIPENPVPTPRQWFPAPGTQGLTQAEMCMEEFVSKLEKTTECERIYIDLARVWSETAPDGLSPCLIKATGSLYADLTTSSAYQSLKPYFDAFAQENNGELPHMAETARRRLEYGKQVTEKTLATHKATMRSFSRWFLELLDSAGDPDALTVLIFPQSKGLPDDYDKPSDRTRLFGLGDVFSIYAFGYLAGCPDMVLPIAEVPFWSDRTQSLQHLPVSVSIVSRPGADEEMLDLIDFLHEKDVLRSVAAGPRLFP